MTAFEVYVNGRYLFTAGVEGRSVLTQTLAWLGGDRLPHSPFDFRVGGIDGATGEYVD